MKRQVLWAASAVVSCASIALAAGGTSVAGAAVASTVVSGTRIATPLPPHLHATRGAIDESSSNWSGYAQVSTTPDTFAQVTDTFVVPTVVPSARGNQYVADWVGIGGYTGGDSTLVQDGIQAVIHTRGHHSTVTYDAWTEHLPRDEKPLALTVSAGDTVTAIVQETATDTWLMEVVDDTTNLNAATTVHYVASGLSAEAIMERPCVRAPCRTQDLAHLAQTSNETFGPGSYSTEVLPAGQTPTEEPLLALVADQTLADIVMTNNSDSSTIATPSPPSSEQDGFVVADGAEPPLAPNV